MNDRLLKISPALNEAPDRARIAEIFARYGRVHIPSFLTSDGAARVHHCVEQQTQYTLTVNSG